MPSRTILWKLKREALRLAKQVAGAGLLLGGPLRRMRHDANLDDLVVIQGDLEFGQDAAIVLIYQPNGLLGSVSFTLDHLNSRGITPVVVSNHPLSETDRTKLRSRSSLVIERPNIGYDFGGYRDGILTLDRLGQRPRRLIVMNDSVWFPLHSDSSFLNSALAAPEDLYGVFYSKKSLRVAHHYLQSYFYRFGPRILEDPRFWQIWRDMPLLNDKRLVIRRFETRLTGQLAALGYSVGAFLNPDDILAAFEKLSDSEVLEVARYHAETTDRGRAIFGNLLAMSSPTDRKVAQFRDRMRNSRMRHYFIDAHPFVSLRLLSSPLVKKGRESHYVAQRALMKEGGYLDELDPVIRAEIETWDS